MFNTKNQLFIQPEECNVFFVSEFESDLLADLLYVSVPGDLGRGCGLDMAVQVPRLSLLHLSVLGFSDPFWGTCRGGNQFNTITENVFITNVSNVNAYLNINYVKLS